MSNQSQLLKFESEFDSQFLYSSPIARRDATSFLLRGGQFSRNFIRWRHRACSTVVEIFRKRSQIKFSSQHFQKWELFSY